MTAKALIAALVLSTSFSASQALALTPDELAKAQKLGSQLNPPVDIVELFAQAEKYGVECAVNSKLRIRSCQTRIDTAILKADTERTRRENTELIRELHRIIDEKN
jgi:hypothetical protein